MNRPELGQTDSEPLHTGTRDAVHCAVVVVKSTDHLYASTPVRFVAGSTAIVESCDWHLMHGSIDPFVEGSIPPGKNVLMLLKPGIAKNLVHWYELDGLPKNAAEDSAQIKMLNEAAGVGEDDDDDDSCKGCT